MNDLKKITINGVTYDVAPGSHLEDKNNPHGLTAEQVGARPDTWMPTPEQIGSVYLATTGTANNQMSFKIHGSSVTGGSSTYDREMATIHAWSQNGNISNFQICYNKANGSPFGPCLETIGNYMPIESVLYVTSGDVTHYTITFKRSSLWARAQVILTPSGVWVEGDVGHLTEGTSMAVKSYAVEDIYNEKCYYRMVDGEQEWLDAPLGLGYEYRTTKRLNGNPVYERLNSTTGRLQYMTPDTNVWGDYAPLMGAAETIRHSKYISSGATEYFDLPVPDQLANYLCVIRPVNPSWTALCLICGHYSGYYMVHPILTTSKLVISVGEGNSLAVTNNLDYTLQFMVQLIKF